MVAIIALCALGMAAEHSAVSIDALIQQGKFAEAQRQIQQLLQKNPNDVHALNLLGRLNRKEAKYGMAEQAFVAAMGVSPKSAETLENLGSLYADEGRIAEAIPLYEALQGINPHSAKVATEMASLYLQNGDFEKSLKTAEAVPVAARPDKLLPVIVADYVGLKQMDDVQRAVPEVLKRAAGNPEVVPQLANVFLQADMVGDAAELLRLAKTRQKATASLLTAEANVQARSGHRDEAKATLKQALALNPNYPEALWGAARMAGSSGDWKQAEELLKRMLRNAPPRKEVLENLVFASTQVNDMQTAHDAADDLLAIDHGSLDSVLVMSGVLIQGLHYGEAEALVQKALKEYPNDKRLHFAAGMAEFNMGKLDEAEPQLTASLGQGAADGQTHYTLGQIASQRGDVPGAIKQMELALALDPKNPSVLQSLGLLYLQSNELDKARTMLEGAVRAAPDNAQNHYQLAMAYRRLGLAPEAQDQMKLFQQLSARHVPAPAGDTPR